jgi:hypothetical protein
MLVFLFLRAIILRGGNNGAVGRCDRIIGRVSSFVRLHVVRAEFEWRDLETMSVQRDSLAFSHYQFTCTVIISCSCYFFNFIILHYYTL